MREIIRTSQFKRQLKLAKKRGKDLQKLVDIVEKLQRDEVLPEHHKDHNLIGNFAEFRECHIEPDWLLIYKKQTLIQDNGEPVEVLKLELTGTHSDLF
ncbi:mRNA interferase YafQ [Moraxella lacunata]|uniref:mRNA interferase YafQ n=1 Tax=Moraxella lacunata TaxID=477 RepID=A0A378T7B0_MORLA|nr:type II toxin-antitoxin system YafQ family toxin [Moraxella lacunata]STZ55765.1 mRNA interferase YafQ [Moraxella lacunata]